MDEFINHKKPEPPSGAFGNYKITPQPASAEQLKSVSTSSIKGPLRKLMKQKNYIYLTNISLCNPSDGYQIYHIANEDELKPYLLENQGIKIQATNISFRS